MSIAKSSSQILHERSYDAAVKVAKEVMSKGSPEIKLKSLNLSDQQLIEVVQLVAVVSAEVTERMFLKYKITEIEAKPE